MTPTETQQAQDLARWLEAGGPVPEGLDPEVVEAVLALRPDLAPAPRVSVDDILGAVTSGPFATPAEPEGGEVVPFPVGPTRPPAESQGRPPAPRWWVLGLATTLAAAAALALIVLPMAEDRSAPSFRSRAESAPTATEEAAPTVIADAERPTEPPTATATPALERGDAAGYGAPAKDGDAAPVGAVGGRVASDTRARRQPEAKAAAAPPPPPDEAGAEDDGVAVLDALAPRGVSGEVAPPADEPRQVAAQRLAEQTAVEEEEGAAGSARNTAEKSMVVGGATGGAFAARPGPKPDRVARAPLSPPAPAASTGYTAADVTTAKKEADADAFDAEVAAARQQAVTDPVGASVRLAMSIQAPATTGQRAAVLAATWALDHGRPDLAFDQATRGIALDPTTAVADQLRGLQARARATSVEVPEAAPR